MESLLLKLAAPIATLIAAALGAGIAFVTTYFIVVKRKKVEFSIATSQNIAPPMSKGQQIKFLIGNEQMSKLNKGGVHVKNCGNMCISQFLFELELLGAYSVCFAEIATSDVNLRQHTKIEQSTNAAGLKIKVSLEFFNPKEEFEVLAYFDGQPDDWKVSFRMEEVRIKVLQGGY